MKESRKKYAALILFTLVTLYFTGSLYVLLCLGVEAVFPFILMVLLRRDVGNMEITGDIRSSCVRNQDAGFRIAVKAKKRLRSVGNVILKVEFSNCLFGVNTIQEIVLPLQNYVGEYDIPYVPGLCGQVQIRIFDMVCSDIFGLCKLKIGKEKTRGLTVYPVEVVTDVITSENKDSLLMGEKNQISRKGSDSSEIFEMREYIPGDSMKSIHWKLSSKSENLLVRQGSDTTNYQIAILFDAGFRSGNKTNDDKILSAAVELSISISRSFIEGGIAHNVIIPTKNELYVMEVQDFKAHERMCEIWMGISLPGECGQGIHLFDIDKLEDNYSKVIYVTARSLSDLILDLAQRKSITAVAVVEGEQEVSAVYHGQGELIKIPANKIYDNRNSIYI